MLVKQGYLPSVVYLPVNIAVSFLFLAGHKIILLWNQEKMIMLIMAHCCVVTYTLAHFHWLCMVTEQSYHFGQTTDTALAVVFQHGILDLKTL